MPVRYARSYVDRLYEAKDVSALYSVVNVVSADRTLPDQFWLFLRLWEWCGATRSGIWQYYESISSRDFEKIAHALDGSGLMDLAEKYRSGMKHWKEPGGCVELDRWIDRHWRELEGFVFDLIADYRQHLYGD